MTSAYFKTLISFTALIVCAASVRAQNYTVTDLGVLSGQTVSTPTGVNNEGEVSGSSGSFAFLYSGGTMRNLGTLGGDISRGLGLNNLAEVVGDSQYSAAGGSIRHAALFRESGNVDLGFLPNFGNYSRASGINDAEQVVGWSGPQLDSDISRAFIWSASSGLMDLGTLGGPYAQALAINNSGFVTGNARAGGISHAFIWDAATGMHDLGSLGNYFSYGTFINANNHVVGYSSINATDNRMHAFLHDGTTMRDLGALGSNDFLSDRSFAYGINIADEVVGWTYLPYTGGALNQVAFIYRNGVMQDLNTLIGSASSIYRLYNAVGINDRGQIAVRAFSSTAHAFHAVLLTPAPAPTSVVSRKTHGSAGTFDISLPLTGNPGLECRSGGLSSDHEIVFTFLEAVTLGDAEVIPETGKAAAMAGPPIISPDGKIVTVNLTNVDDAQTIEITLSAVNDGTTTNNVRVTMDVLLGDINSTGTVNASDVSQTKAQSGQAVTIANFRTDVVVSGTINASDLAFVKSRSGGGLSASSR